MGLKVSRSSDILLSAGGVEGSEEAYRWPTDKCEKSLDIEFLGVLDARTDLGHARGGAVLFPISIIHKVVNLSLVAARALFSNHLL